MLARFISALFRPRHVIIADELSATSSQHRMIRPITPLFIVLLSIFLGISFGLSLPEKLAKNDIAFQALTANSTDNELQQIKRQLAELQAENDIKLHQIDALKKLLQQQQQQFSATKADLRQLTGILSLRKEKGLHILDAKLINTGSDQLSFSAIIVKGGNYPRHIKGTLRFYIQGDGNELRPILFKKDKDTLSFNVETHTFMHGALMQPDGAWQKHDVIAILYDSRGKELTRKTCTYKKEVNL